MATRERAKLPLSQIIEQAANACFIAMAFSRKFEFVFNEIDAPAITNCGLLAIRSDLVLSAAGNVVDEIVRIIQRVRVVTLPESSTSGVQRSRLALPGCSRR